MDLYSYIGNTREVEERLLNTDLDVGIVEGFLKNPDLITIPLLEDPLVLACSRSHPLASKKILHIEDLKISGICHPGERKRYPGTSGALPFKS